MAIGTTAAILGGTALAGGVANALTGGGRTQTMYTPDDLARLRLQEQDAIAQQQAFADAVAAQSGLGRMGDVYGALGQVGTGEGPDIAGAQLAQVTGQNVANQAALMAGQRGAAANPALMARQAAMQGGALQQQAAGQAQTLRLQQQEQQQRLRLAALQQQAGIAGDLSRMQGTAVGNVAASRAGAAGRADTAQLGAAGLQSREAAERQRAMGGALGGIGSAAMTIAGFSEGGSVPDLQSFLDAQPEGMPAFKPMAYGKRVPGKARVRGDSPKNDTVPALLSPGEIVVPRSKAKDPKKAAAFAAAVARRGRK